VTIARADARARGITNGATVKVSRDGISVELRAQLSNTTRTGVVLVADEHAQGLSGPIDLALSTPTEAKAQ